MATEQQIRNFFAKRLNFIVPEENQTGNRYGQINFDDQEVVLGWEVRPTGMRRIHTISVDRIIEELDLTNLSTFTVQGVKDHINALSELSSAMKAKWISIVDQLDADGVFDP